MGIQFCFHQCCQDGFISTNTSPIRPLMKPSSQVSACKYNFGIWKKNCMIIYYTMLQMFYLLSPNCTVAVYPECTAPSTSHHAEQDENKADVDQPAKKVSSLTILSSKSLQCKGLLIVVINKTFCSYFYWHFVPSMWTTSDHQMNWIDIISHVGRMSSKAATPRVMIKPSDEPLGCLGILVYMSLDIHSSLHGLDIYSSLGSPGHTF